jgi:hypothetical protein
MEKADQTIEMPVPGSPNASIPPEGGGAADRVRPVFPATSTLETRIPEAMRRNRPSPALDPIARSRVSRLAKWIMLVAILAFVAYLPGYFYNSGLAQQALTGDVDRSPFFLAAVTAAAVFAAVLATGLPRLILPKLFGRWHEAVEALRDWMIVGLITGVLYYLAVIGARGWNFGPVAGVQTESEWMTFRLPLLLIAGVVGVFAARLLAIRREGLVANSVGVAILQIVVQVALLGALEHPIEKYVRSLSMNGTLSYGLGWLALLCAVTAVGIVSWAMAADANLSVVRRRRGATGIEDGTGPVELTLTVIGGRESGKTVLLAAAFYEWSTQHIGDLRITPAEGASATGMAGTASLEDVARELYVNNQFPVGTVSTQNLPFDLSLGHEKIARFTFLDYPGGAIAGRVADSGVVQEFWERVEDTDGIVMIADMSYVRRAKKDSDWLEVRNAYRTVMQRLVDRNGKRRVVPVALVLTKCDEFIDHNTGHIDVAALEAGLKEFQYDELQEEWRRLNATNGPGFVEFTTWITSAITYSQPQIGVDGRPDYSRPFQIAPAPPSIAPTGCASPLLWMTSKVMRWNATMFYDISTFLFGYSPHVRQRVDAVLELERIAEERAGRA